MKPLLAIVFLFVLTISCRQVIIGDKNLRNAKKMSGVWEVYEVSTNTLNGTLMMFYNLENNDHENSATYYRANGNNSDYYWWMYKKDTLYLYSTETGDLFKYAIKELEKRTCKLQRPDGTFLKLNRKKY
ncbi:MAG TPA: hypothetical protein PLP65_03280 [Bacteroidales bacterium]|mgnify:CR=1 FL=1|nr:hypothetical protein [Bacteroidales bacterium]